MNTRVRVASVCAFLAIWTAACGFAPPGPSDDSADQVPKTAPDFALEDLQGRLVRLSDSDGQVRLVDFWATWCPPCREAIPEFKELHSQYGDKGLTILAISMDDDAKSVLPPFLEKWKIPYTNLIGSEEVAESFGGVFGLPTTFLVDREGHIADHWVGPVPKEVFEKRIRELLGLAASG